MAGFGIKTPWTRQPQYPVRCDVFGLRDEFVWLGSLPDAPLQSKPSFTRGASLTNAIINDVKSVSFVGNTSNAYTRSGGNTAAQTKCTFAGVFTWQSGAANNYPQLAGFSTTNTGFRIGSNLQSGGDLCLVKGGVVALATITITSGVQYAYVCSHRQDTGEYYLLAKPINGGETLRASGTDTQASLAGDGIYAVGTARTDFSGAWNGDIGFAFGAFDFLPEARAKEWLKNIWQAFQPLTRKIFVPSAAGGDSVTGNPITWQWEQNNSSVSESLNSSPTDWAWFVQTGVLVESVQASPTAWEWTVTTGDIVEGSQDILTTTPVNWEWAQGSVSFVDKLEGNPVSWEWAVTTGTQTESLEANPIGWEWTTYTGELLGTTAIDTNPVSWEWEVTTGLLVQVIPEVGGTIGGKKDKHLRLPFYDKGKKYDSRIDLDEVYESAKSKPTNPVADSDLVSVDARSDKRVDGDIDVRQNIKPDEPGGRLVSELLQEIKGQSQPVSVIEFPAIAGEPEGFDEEAAVIMLLLAA